MEMIDPNSTNSRDPSALGNGTNGFLPPISLSNGEKASTGLQPSERAKRGVIIGKFWPFHIGHQYLCETALLYCEELYIIVCYRPKQYPTLDIRVSWVRASVPRSHCLGIWNVYDPRDSNLWATLTKAWCGFTPDYVFTSEEYGAKWASCLVCEHVLVDASRAAHPVSGTMIREALYDPTQYKQHYIERMNQSWQFLPLIIQHHFTKQVIVVLSPSSLSSRTSIIDESSFCQQLAVLGNARYVQKRHDEEKAISWKGKRNEEFAAIQSLSDQENKLLIQDRNAIACHAYHNTVEALLDDADLADREILFAVKSVLLLFIVSEDELERKETENTLKSINRDNRVIIDSVETSFIAANKANDELLISQCHEAINVYIGRRNS